MSRITFSDRRELWAKESLFKYIPTPHFEEFISRKPFEGLISCIAFSSTPVRDDQQSDVRWDRVSGFVKAINEFRESNFTPSEYICVDESKSRWYGLRGDWCDLGLPRYVAMDRKPENGCELKTSACSKSGVMLRIELVTGQEDNNLRDFEHQYQDTTAVTLQLVQPLLHSNRLVCRDSYFRSVTTAEALLAYNTKFIRL